MALSPKELKKLAKACRDAGIKTYKGDGFEIQLTDEAPQPKRQAKKVSPTGPYMDASEMKIESDIPTNDELLYWSTGTGAIFGEEETEAKQ